MNYSYGVLFGAGAAARAGAAPAPWQADDEAVRGYLTKDLVEWCEMALAEFKFVNWDRLIFTRAKNGQHIISCYGWIDRKQDAYKDFIFINLILDAREVVYVVSSSAERDPEIGEICAGLSGVKGYALKKCARVEDLFEAPNVIRLHGREKEGKQL